MVRGVAKHIKGDLIEKKSLLVLLKLVSLSGIFHRSLAVFITLLLLSHSVAVTLNNIGIVYSDLGEKQKALDYYNQSLPLTRAVGNKVGEAVKPD